MKGVLNPEAGGLPELGQIIHYYLLQQLLQEGDSKRLGWFYMEMFRGLTTSAVRCGHYCLALWPIGLNE